MNHFQRTCIKVKLFGPYKDHAQVWVLESWPDFKQYIICIIFFFPCWLSNRTFRITLWFIKGGNVDQVDLPLELSSSMRSILPILEFSESNRTNILKQTVHETYQRIFTQTCTQQLTRKQKLLSSEAWNIRRRVR